MMRHKFTIGAVALAFAVSAAPALGQENPRSGSPGSRSSGGGERTGAAVPRGGSSGGGASGGGSMGSSSSPSAPSSSGSTMRAPSRMGSASGERAGAVMRAPRRSDDAGQATGRRAVPRGGTASAPAAPATRTGRSTTRTTGAGGGSDDRAAGRRTVVNTRPRATDRPVTGRAVERGSVTRPGGTDFIYIYRPSYNPWGFYGPGLGYGLGYLYYDPFWSGSYGYGSYGYGGYGYGGGYYSGSGGYSQTYQDTGALRLKLKPREAEVYVDGYYVGVVDSFDGMFQKLRLDGGGHRVEVRADGYAPLQFDVLITPGETVTYKGEMESVVK